jgi:molybdopterin-guanine dinucleotide biosynthesis protein A
VNTEAVGFDASMRGYVLAGGGSTRFGRDKALVEFGGTPLLLRIVELAETCASPAIVIANAEKYRRLHADLEIVEDRWPGEGPLGGIITALQHTATADPACSWNLILSCDMPFLSPGWLQYLVSRAFAARPDTQIILPHTAHGPEPLCACYRTDAFDALRNVFEGGIRKVTAALKPLPTEVLDESAWKRFDSAGRLFWNMNTPADFIEAQRLWESENT